MFFVGLVGCLSVGLPLRVSVDAGVDVSSGAKPAEFSSGLLEHFDAILGEVEVAEDKLDPSRFADDLVRTWDDPTVRENVDRILRHAYAVLIELDAAKPVGYSEYAYYDGSWDTYASILEEWGPE